MEVNPVGVAVAVGKMVEVDTATDVLVDDVCLASTSSVGYWSVDGIASSGVVMGDTLGTMPHPFNIAHKVTVRPNRILAFTGILSPDD
jgi:hypothetical protein